MIYTEFTVLAALLEQEDADLWAEKDRFAAALGEANWPDSTRAQVQLLFSHCWRRARYADLEEVESSFKDLAELHRELTEAG